MTNQELKNWRKSLPEPQRPGWRRGPRPKCPSQAEAARMLGVSRRAYISWETGERTVPAWVAQATDTLAGRRDVIKTRNYW